MPFLPDSGLKMAEASSNPPVLAEELASIAARAQTYTGASGAPIALSEGEQTEMVCRACSGPSAPDVGAHLTLEGTFTGLAVQSGQALRCDDSDNDKRVDAAACRALGTRSIVVVPIRDVDTEAVTGVLAVFSGNKNSFNDLHVAVLRTMAREVAVAVQKARKAGIPIGTASRATVGSRPSDPGFTPPRFTPPPVSTPVAPPPSAFSSSAAAAARPALEPAATVMTPPPLSRPAPPPPFRPVQEVQPMAAPIASPPTPHRGPPGAPEWSPAPAPPARRGETVEPPRTESSKPLTTSFGTFDSVGQAKKPGGMGIWIGVAAAAVVVVGGYFGYSAFSSKPEAPTTQAAQSSAPPSTTPAEPASSTPATGTPLASTTTPPTTTSAPTATTTNSQPAAQPA